jgi:hypothetical protein
VKKTDTLADWLHAWTYDTRPIYENAFPGHRLIYGNDAKSHEWQAHQKLDFRMAMRKAERVVLDDAFMHEIAKKTIGQPPEMLAMAGLALLPFEKMFVEWDDNVRIRAVCEAAKAAGGDYGHDPDTDYGRAGLLFERLLPGDPKVWSIAHVSDSEGSLPVWPYAAVFGDEAYYEKTRGIDIPGSPMENLMASGWGYVGREDNATQFAIHEELLARGIALPEHRFFMPITRAMLKDPANTGTVLRFCKTTAQQNAGTLRWGTAILASLNTVPTVRAPREASGHFQHRLRSIPKLSTVHVSIDAKPGHEVAVYDKHFHEATGRHNRRHEVRGHWRVVDSRRKGVPSTPYWMCAHVAADEDGLYALCGKCGHLLRWIDHHERGDAALGYVIKDGYDVKG